MAATSPHEVRGDPGCGSYGGGARFGWWLLPLALVSSVVIAGLVAVGLGWHWWGAPGYGPVPFLWPIFPLSLFLVVFTVFFVFRWAVWGGRGWTGHGHGDTLPAGEVLRLRYARGELTTEQFRQMSHELESSSAR